MSTKPLSLQMKNIVHANQDYSPRVSKEVKQMDSVLFCTRNGDTRHCKTVAFVAPKEDMTDQIERGQGERGWAI